MSDTFKAETYSEETKLLSAKEKEIVLQICRDKREWEIAEEMDVSVNTLKTQKREIYFKLRVNSHVRLVVAALQMGEITLDEI